MIIGIDGNEANVVNRVGIGEYAFELLKQFENFKSPISNLQFQIYLKDKPRADLPKERNGWQYRIVGPRKLWTQIGLPLDLYIHKPRPDVFFTPTHYAPRFAPVPTVISVMDLSYIHHPSLFKKSDLYQLTNWTKYSVKHAKRVFTISEFSKNDIINEYSLPKNKVIVTYPGIKQIAASKNKKINMEILETKYGITGNYILFVGTLQPRKNIVRLIESFKKIVTKKEFSHVTLAIVGKRGWLFEEILEAPQKLGVQDNVKFLEFVSSEDLPLFYQNATCFVLPSLYEGFGLPVVEAMQQGCPVVTSNISSLPEAGGDAALYVDPENVDDIAEKLHIMITDEKVRKGCIEKGYKQAKKFSWEKTAKETLSVLEEVATKG